MNRNLIVERGEDGMTMSTKSGQIVVKEFPQAVGKYRIRVVKSAASGKLVVDIREYAKGKNYEGFTRKGIRLTREELQQLFKMMGEIGHLLGNGETK